VGLGLVRLSGRAVPGARPGDRVLADRSCDDHAAPAGLGTYHAGPPGGARHSEPDADPRPSGHHVIDHPAGSDRHCSVANHVEPPGEHELREPVAIASGNPHAARLALTIGSADCDADILPVCHTVGHSYPNRHADTDGHPVTDSNCNSDPDADADADAHPHAYPQTHAYTYANPNAYAYPDTHTYANAHANAHAYPDTHTYAHAHAHAYPHANAYSDTLPNTIADALTELPARLVRQRQVH
jgi:hypothetical protein